MAIHWYMSVRRHINSNHNLYLKSARKVFPYALHAFCVHSLWNGISFLVLCFNLSLKWTFHHVFPSQLIYLSRGRPKNCSHITTGIWMNLETRVKIKCQKFVPGRVREKRISNQSHCYHIGQPFPFERVCVCDVFSIFISNKQCHRPSLCMFADEVRWRGWRRYVYSVGHVHIMFSLFLCVYVCLFTLVNVANFLGVCFANERK